MGETRWKQLQQFWGDKASLRLEKFNWQFSYFLAHLFQCDIGLWLRHSLNETARGRFPSLLGFIGHRRRACLRLPYRQIISQQESLEGPVLARYSAVRNWLNALRRIILR
jgi:hypothetical protein